VIHYLRAKYHATLTVIPEMGYDDYLPIARGATYTIRIRQKMFGRIQVQPMRDDDPSRELVGAQITYPTLFHFFQDWEPKQVSLDPGAFKRQKENLYHGSK